MKNISKKIIASLMLATFVFSNSLLAVSAMEDVNSKPVLRDNANFSMKLKGDKDYIQSKTPVSISLRDSDVKQVLRMFADKAGMNIIFHDSVSGNVTLDLVDVPLNSAFDMVMDINGLNYVVDGKTIVVAKSGAANFNMGKQEMTLIPVKYVNASAVAEFLNKNIYGMNKPGLSNAEIATTNPATNELIIFGNENDVAIAKKVIAKFDKKPTTTTFKVNHTTPAEMATMICNMLIPASGSAGSNSGTETNSETGAAAGIMTGAAASYDSSGDGESSSGSSSGGSSKSLSLNAGSVACSMDGKMNGSLGLQNLSVAYYSQLGTISVVGGSESQLEMIKDFIAHTDKKQPQAYLEVSIIELTEDGSKELTNTWHLWSSFFSGSFEGGSVSTNPIHPTMFKGSGWQLVKANDDGGYEPVEGGYFGKYHGPVTISYAINYLVKNGKARVVVNPRIIITNGVESKIEVTQDYLESVDIDSSTSTGGTVVTREYNISDDKGVTVTIMPYISPDGYVTLNITPEYSTEIGAIDGTESIGGREITYKAATLLSHRNLDLKNVRIKDGETLVIGGMIQETETKTVSKVPVLGDIPGIGALFRNTISAKGKSEMVIMLTPKIITDSEDAVGNTDTL